MLKNVNENECGYTTQEANLKVWKSSNTLASPNIYANSKHGII